MDLMNGYNDENKHSEETILAEINTSHRNVVTDENMLPVHFLPEGRKCYDWVKKDIEQEENINQDKLKIISEEEETGTKTERTTSVNNIRYTSCHIGTPLSDNKAIVKLLLKSAEHGDHETLKGVLTQHSCSINSTDNDGYTALHRASYNGHKSVVLFLLEHSSNVNAKTDDGWEPLHCAARWNHANVCRILLGHNADINATTNGQQTSLHFAAISQENIEILEMLLLQPSIDVNIVNGTGDTAYDLAHRSGPQVTLFEMKNEGLNI